MQNILNICPSACPNTLVCYRARRVPLCYASWQNELSMQKYDRYVIQTLKIQFEQLLTCQDPEFQDWLQSIPSDILATVKPFPFAFDALRYAAGGVYAQQLLLSQPLLFALLVHDAILNEFSVNFFVQQMSLKRIELLQSLNPIGTRISQSALKFLTKIRFTRLSLDDCYLLINIIFNGKYKKLAHIQEISIDLLRILADINFSVPFKLLKQIKTAKQLSNFHHELVKLLGCIRQINDLEQINKLFMRIKKTSSLKSLFAKIDEFCLMAKASAKSVNFIPPIKGNDKITPITSAFDLFLWGRKQRNCAYDYVAKVEKGEYFFYIIKEVDITIGLINDNNQWCLDDVLSRFNQDVSLGLVEYVQQWLKSSVVKINRRDKPYDRYYLSYSQMQTALMEYHSSDMFNLFDNTSCDLDIHAHLDSD